jgi:hypothetical protein
MIASVREYIAALELTQSASSEGPAAPELPATFAGEATAQRLAELAELARAHFEWRPQVTAQEVAKAALFGKLWSARCASGAIRERRKEAGLPLMPVDASPFTLVEKYGATSLRAARALLEALEKPPIPPGESHYLYALRQEIEDAREAERRQAERDAAAEQEYELRRRWCR